METKNKFQIRNKQNKQNKFKKLYKIDNKTYLVVKNQLKLIKL